MQPITRRRRVVLLGAINGQLGEPMEAKTCFRYVVALQPVYARHITTSVTRDRHSGRVGGPACYRKSAYPPHIASSCEDYNITRTARLASDKAGLKELRDTLRHMMAASSLCNAGRLTREIENAYRTM
jgi:hypothetical protein